MEDTTVYFLLTDTGSWLTQTIKFFTKKKYNHCSLAFDSELENTYSFGRINITNPFIGGFVHEDTLSAFFLQSNCALYSLKVTSKEKERLEHYMEFMEENKERFRYNFLGLAAVLFQIEWERKDYYFCSQFIGTVLKDAGIFTPAKSLSFITPEDILNALPFELVYEGLLLDYYQNRIWLQDPLILHK